MSKFRIELTENGVSILTQKTQILYDEAGNPVEIPQGNHRQAIGVKDFDTVEEFQQAIQDLTGSVIGTDFATGIASIKAAVDMTESKQAEIDTLGFEIADLRKQLSEKEAVLSERDKRIAALEERIKPPVITDEVKGE